MESLGSRSDRQTEAADYRAGPLRVRGPSRSGKTTVLLERARRLAAEGPGRVLVLAAARAEGPTFVDLAIEILGRHAVAPRALSAREQAVAVAELLGTEGAREWPTLHPDLAEPAFAAEVAATVCAYQASFLGLEELRTHAHAAGELERWEELAAFTERYQAALAEGGATDWAGALVAASLLLRDPKVRQAEVSDLRAVLVDDWETATFATNRLLTQLGGHGGDVHVTVAGNPATAIAGSTGGNASYLNRFVTRFTGAKAIELDQRGRSRPAATVVDDGGIAGMLQAEHEGGCPWESMAVIAHDGDAASVVATRLSDAGIPAVTEKALTRWEEPGPPVDEAVTVVALETTSSRSWPLVAVAGCSRSPAVVAAPRWFDLELLAGPDVPDVQQRQVRAEQEAACAFELATSRAIDRLIVEVSDGPVTPGGFHLPDLPDG